MDTIPKEYKCYILRECPTPPEIISCDTPEKVMEYYNLHVKTHQYYNPDVECFFVLLLNTRKRVKGHVLISTGTMDTLLIHPREVFKVAIVESAACIILIHNHPSGDSFPSDADIRVTRDLIRAGQLLKIEVCDHIIMGNKEASPVGRGYCSLREFGSFDF